MTLRKEKGKLVEKLKHLDDDTCKEAINLLQRVNDLEITSGEIASCKNQMKRYLSSSKPLFKLQWSSDEEKELVQHRHASWNSISNKIDKEILRKINQKIEEDGQLSEFRSLKNKYIKLRKAAFQPHLKELDRIKKATDINENNHRTLKDLAVPVAAPASAIVASRFIPHHGMMLATPLIGLLLLGYGAFEEYRDWQDDKEKARFERDKTGYLESRTNSKIEDLIKDLSAEGDDEKRFSKLSDTFRAIFGDSIRKHILDELSIIIQNCLSGKTMVSHIKQKHADVSDEFRIKLFNKFQEIHTSFLDLCRLQTIEGDCGAEVMHLGDYARRLYQQRNKPVFEVVKSCTTVKYGTDTSKQLKLCEEYLFRHVNLHTYFNFL